MAEKDKEDLADALAALAAGEHVEPEAPEEHDHLPPDAPLAPPHAPPYAPPPPASAPPPTKPAVRPRPTQPGAPVAHGVPEAPRPRPAAPLSPSAPGRAPAPARPAAPSRPPAAAARTPMAPAARPGRPPGAAAPPPPPSPTPPVGRDEFIVREESDDEQIVPDALVDQHGGEWVGTAPADDDATVAPAPDFSALPSRPLGYRPPHARAAKRDVKQTMIPILLTTGVLLIAFGVLRFLMGPDSPYAGLPTWLSALASGTGLLLIAAAILTMLHVKSDLARAEAEKAARQ